MKKCVTRYCRNSAREGRSICRTCESRKRREKDPVRAAFDNLRSNTKRRKKEFTITLEEFEKFCAETEYMFGKGRTATSYHIDRIDPEKGYSIDNIRVLTNSENVKRHRKYLKYVETPSGPQYFRFESNEISEDGDCPF